MTDSPATPTSTNVPRPMTSSASGMRARRGVSSTRDDDAERSPA